jgi:hypothetical protein
VFVAVVLAIRRNRRDIKTVEPAEPAAAAEQTAPTRSGAGSPGGGA